VSPSSWFDAGSLSFVIGYMNARRVTRILEQHALRALLRRIDNGKKPDFQR
jgi:hypothetical protein